MKIDVYESLYHGYSDSGMTPATQLLVHVWDSYVTEYEQAAEWWQYVIQEQHDQLFVTIVQRLPSLAAWLRTQGWHVYYWRDRLGMPAHMAKGDPHNYLLYGQRHGLIFGAYCDRLTMWKITHA